MSETRPAAEPSIRDPQRPPTVSVVIPVYYNEPSLPPLFEELRATEAALAERGFAMELVFVDDGSGDGSFDVLRQFKEARPGTRLVRLTRNFGAVHASKTGLSFISGDCFAIVPADLQDPPALVVEMCERWRKGAKYVVCARAHRNDPLSSRAFSAIYYRLLRWFVVPDYPTGGYDLALMDRAFLPFLVHSSKNINTPLFAYWLGFKPEVMSYTRRERHHGRSRWTFSKKVKFFLDSLLGFSIVPIRTILVVGILVSLLSFAYGFSILVNAALGRVDVRGFATLAAIVLFLIGLVIVMLGVIGEYIWRIFDEVNKRPESVIDEVL